VHKAIQISRDTVLADLRVAIWPVLKLFVRNKMLWPFGHFLAFLNVDKNSISKGMF